MRGGLPGLVPIALGGNSEAVAISADGRYVAFNSFASNIVAGDTNGGWDAFVRDTLTGVTTRISTDSAGGQGNSNSFARAISADGRYVAFGSSASNLVAGDTNGMGDAFIKDTLTGVTTRVSTDSAGNQVNSYSSATAISADGRYVAFNSTASNLVAGDTNSAQDAFIKDTVTGVTTRISTDSAGGQANNASQVTAISADGRFVAFNSSASNLVAGDTNGLSDSFMKDLVTDVTTRVSTDSAGEQGNAYSNVRAISADGRYVAFHSTASNFVAGDTNGTADAFVKDMVTGVTRRISTDSAGGQGNSGSSVSAISADGRFVAFYSGSSNLVAGDTNGLSDSFMKDLVTDVTTRVSTASNGAQGIGLGGSTDVVVSADGRFLAFTSYASNLVSGDTNVFQDVFLKDLTKTGVNQISGLIVSNRVSAGVTQMLTARARTELTEYRASLGTSLTRINSFVNTLNSATINLQEAAARIKDADIAEEASRLMAARMRQEVAANLLRQTNLQPSLALLLLKG